MILKMNFNFNFKDILRVAKPSIHCHHNGM
jgi:hypothetical protein